MSAPATPDDLVQLIRRSSLLDDQRLMEAVRRWEVQGGLPTDPKALADALIGDGLLTFFQAEQFLLGKWRGFTIGKYKLLERVGVGGMGQVFLCEHLFMKRRVAVKVLPPAKAEHPSALGRFYREARAAGALEHPNIVRTYDIDQDGNLHFIVMEYVDGSNLLDVVKKFGPLDIGRATDYARQVAVGLDYAFGNGIIHRDIKPGNVLIDRSGTARILDMGLARFYRDQTDLLTVKYDDKVVLGTADYVAPEQVANSHAVDIRADIYALGATLYFLLAGHPPFPTGTVSQKLMWHRTKDPTPIREVRPEVPEGLAAVLARMMAKDPANRYQTPGEAAAALERWVPERVPLPADEEMPHLSPAAVAGLVQAESPRGAELPTAATNAVREPSRTVSPVSTSSRVEVLLPRRVWASTHEIEPTTDAEVAHDATPADLRSAPPEPTPVEPAADRPRPSGTPVIAAVIGSIAATVALAGTVVYWLFIK
jgi:serine/threonine protein kinase